MTAVLLLACAVLPACSAEAAETKHVSISTEADLCAFAQSCRLDTWSNNTVVTLTNDIVLHGSFSPVPIFSGVFEGGGHTISGLEINGRYENPGFFGILTESAEVRNLNISGSVNPKGSVKYTGGLASINRGYVDGCSFAGSVSSDTVTGGLAGLNEGIIINSSNSSTVDGAISKGIRVKLRTAIQAVKAKKLSGLIEIITKKAINVTDDCSGGICGLNKGSVVACVNTGSVGSTAKGVNYYSGGISGRNDGCIYLCSNAGAVSGDYNVGGIAGISTPHFKSVSTGNLLGNAQNDVDSIIDIVNSVTYSLDDGAKGITDAVSGIAGSLGNAMTNVSQLEREITAFANGKIEEVNQVSNYVNTAAKGVKGVTGELSDVGDDVNRISGYVYDGVNEFKNVYEEQGFFEALGRAIPYFSSAIEEIPVVISDVNDITTEMDNTINMLNEAGMPEFSKISPGVDYAASCLTGNLRAATDQIKALSSSLNSFENSLTEDVRSVTSLAQELSDRTFNIIYQLDDINLEYFIKDTSGDTPAADNPLPGIINCCVNTGSISGKKNVGGIAGALDFTEIPEIDKEATEENSYEKGFSIKTLQYCDVVSNSRNYGNVTASDSYSGGIAGHIGVGAVSECQSYGSVYSEGNYAGGISGSGGGTLRDNFVRCRVSGSDYVGGVVGSGAEKSLLNSGTNVMRNYADVSIASDDIHYGAIAGADTGSFLYNYFVTGSLNGIGAYSREYSAAPVNKSQILELPNCPEEFGWSSDRLASAAAVNESSVSDGIKNLSSGSLIAIMCALLAVIAVLIVLLVKKPADAASVSTSNYKQPWKD